MNASLTLTILKCSLARKEKGGLNVTTSVRAVRNVRIYSAPRALHSERANRALCGEKFARGSSPRATVRSRNWKNNRGSARVLSSYCRFPP